MVVACTPLHSCGSSLGEREDQRLYAVCFLVTLGGGRSLLLPDFAPNERRSIGKGWQLLAVPGGLTDHIHRSPHLEMGQQRDEGEQPEQGRNRAADRSLRPLAVRLQLEVPRSFLRGCVKSMYELGKRSLPRRDRHVAIC